MSKLCCFFKKDLRIRKFKVFEGFLSLYSRYKKTVFIIIFLYNRWLWPMSNTSLFCFQFNNTKSIFFAFIRLLNNELYTYCIKFIFYQFLFILYFFPNKKISDLVFAVQVKYSAQYSFFL